ncbi:DUF418 domain-containing protein [Pelagibacterium sp. 26DY04]|uniref:DUF418 domain-containing protein n=1 Tax=Pelagibacterium sp. 26DY04 TaxID=2967130 RepID=UPI002814DF6B|nr:DUF418 domain-containing protein [Pelagibacterium sp. 26DY04]WMT86276.1 DUF418 domain-containing protein [Pelagibacterium sp. 26DY04]
MSGTASTSAAKGRIGGLDAARALAVIGMLMVHVGSRGRDTLGETFYNLPHGRASILFGFLAGVSMALLSEGAGKRGLARARLGWMAVVFLPLGLVLQRLDHGIAVILHHYAAFYLLGILMLAVPRRYLPAIAALLSIAGPLIYFLLNAQWPDRVDRDTVAAGDNFVEIAGGLLVTGPYPLVTWSAALVWGLWVGRLDLRAPSTQLRLATSGAGIAFAAAVLAIVCTPLLEQAETPADWRWLFDGRPHSQMPLWLIGAIGSAVAVTGIMLIAVRRFPKWFSPLVALGQLALSFYVAHLFLLHMFAGVLRRESVGEAMISVVAISGAAMVFAVLWRRYFQRGPLEALLVWPFQPVLTPSPPRIRPDP